MAMKNLSQTHKVFRSALQALFSISARKVGHFQLESNTVYFKINMLQLLKYLNPSDHRQHMRGLVLSYTSEQRQYIFDTHL